MGKCPTDALHSLASVNYPPICLAASRCAKRHNGIRSKAINYRILAVFPGPNIAKNLRAYLSRTVRAFREFGVRSDGMEVGVAWC